jgi:hypothetical protein
VFHALPTTSTDEENYGSGEWSDDEEPNKDQLADWGEFKEVDPTDCKPVDRKRDMKTHPPIGGTGSFERVRRELRN